MAGADLPFFEKKAAEEVDTDRERDISQEEPKVGVFICDCGENIGGVIDVETPRQTCR